MALIPFSALLKDISKKCLDKKGYVISTLINNWDFIIGDDYGPYCYPKKVTFFEKRGTLHLGVYSQSLILPLQHMQGFLIEKINLYFGYKAIEKIVLTKEFGNISSKKTLQPSQEVKDPPLPNPRIQEILKNFPEGEVKKRLENLGSYLYER